MHNILEGYQLWNEILVYHLGINCFTKYTLPEKLLLTEKILVIHRKFLHRIYRN